MTHARLAALPVTFPRALSRGFARVFPCALAGFAAAAQDADPSSRIPAALHMDGERLELPFRLDGPLPIPVVEATLEGRGPFRFYVDTGAGITVLDDALVDELGLKVVGTRPLGDPSASARIEARDLFVERLELGGVVLEGFRAAGMQAARFGGGGGVRGVLGLPLFHDRLLTLDYAGERLVLETGELPSPGERGGEHVAAYDAHGPPKVALELPGRTVDAAIDSGSPSSFSLPAAVAAELPWRDEPVVVGRARTVNSEFEIRQGTLDGTIRLAGHAFEDPVVRMNDVFPHANVGYEVLKDLRLTIDQRNARVRFERPAPVAEVQAGSGPRRAVRANAPAGRRSLGVMMAPSGERLQATGVVPGSAAESAGMRAGDTLVAVDGRPVTFVDPAALHEALAGSAAIRLTVEREGTEIELVIPATTGAADDPNKRLDAMLGNYRIEATVHSNGDSPEGGAREIKGRATFERSHDGRFVHERFALTLDEQALEGDLWIAWREGAGRYELTQIDGFNPATLWLTGTWDAARQRLALRSVAGSRIAGRPELLWEYRFEPGGSFVKELRAATEEGGSRLLSEYRYIPN